MAKKTWKVLLVGDKNPITITYNTDFYTKRKLISEFKRLVKKVGERGVMTIKIIEDTLYDVSIDGGGKYWRNDHFPLSWIYNNFMGKTISSSQSRKKVKSKKK